MVAVLFVSSAIFIKQHFTSQPPASFEYGVEVAFPNLSFDYPDGIFSPNDGTNRLFVVSQLGFIYVFENNRNATSTGTFLDVYDKVHKGALLGLAFHPNFEKNGYFYVHYLADNPLRTIIARWSVSSDKPDEADINSQKILLEIPQLSDAHAGGQLAFGPDGYLYIAVGDGSPSGDIYGHAQNLSFLQGKILRINVDAKSEKMNYGIPNDNPFVGNSLGFREEIYAYGLRNPWRFSFDSKNGMLVAGDVGQDRMEEIDLIKRGQNYGWNIMEGTLPYSGSYQTGLEMPIWVYEHGQGNCTIGGFVYQGSKLPELGGSYIYGDYVTGRIWSLSNYSTLPLNKELASTGLLITSFGVDDKNELYFCAQDGKVYSLFHSAIDQ